MAIEGAVQAAVCEDGRYRVDVVYSGPWCSPCYVKRIDARLYRGDRDHLLDQGKAFVRVFLVSCFGARKERAVEDFGQANAKVVDCVR